MKQDGHVVLFLIFQLLLINQHVFLLVVMEKLKEVNYAMMGILLIILAVSLIVLAHYKDTLVQEVISLQPLHAFLFVGMVSSLPQSNVKIGMQLQQVEMAVLQLANLNHLDSFVQLQLILLQLHSQLHHVNLCAEMEW